MDKLIVKLFGVNRMNLIGWIWLGFLLIVAAVFFIITALPNVIRQPGRPDQLLLAAIAILLLGIFGVLLQIYCAMLAEKLERKPRPTRRDEADAEYE